MKAKKKIKTGGCTGKTAACGRFWHVNRAVRRWRCSDGRKTSKYEEREKMASEEKLTEIKKRNIPFSPPDISELEINEVAEALRSGWITTGPRTKELERRLADFCHTSKVVCLNSATAAEELNFRICGIGEGEEVIVPAYTYTATGVCCNSIAVQK